MTVDLDAIRARLAAATPPPWAAGVEIDPADGYWNREAVHAVDALPVAILRRDEEHSDADLDRFDEAHDRGVVAETHGYSTIADVQHDANQALIAHAPTDLADLLGLVDTLRAAGDLLAEQASDSYGRPAAPWLADGHAAWRKATS